MNILKQILISAIGTVFNNYDNKIIFYHDVYSEKPLTVMATPLSLFEQHIKIAKESGFNTVSSFNTSTNQIQVCFDDGFSGIWECKDYFVNLPWKPTIFLAVDLIGKPNYLTKEMILELQKLGFRFQSHGWTHRPLTEVPVSELAHETLDSKNYLENMLGTEVFEICFPVGMFSQRVLSACQEAKYCRMYSSVPGCFSHEIFPGVVRRNLVQYYSPSLLKKVLLGGLIPFSGHYLRKHFQN